MENKKQKLVEAFWMAGMSFIVCMTVGFIALALWVSSVDWVTNNTNWTLYSWRIAEQLHGWNRLKCIQVEYICIIGMSIYWFCRTFKVWYKR